MALLSKRALASQIASSPVGVRMGQLTGRDKIMRDTMREFMEVLTKTAAMFSEHAYSGDANKGLEVYTMALLEDMACTFGVLDNPEFDRCLAMLEALVDDLKVLRKEHS